MFRPPKQQPKPEGDKKQSNPDALTPEQIADAIAKALSILKVRGGGAPQVTRGLLTSADVVSAIQSGTWNIDNLLNPHPVSQSGTWNINNLLNPHPVTQTTRTLMAVKPEREDLTSLGGVVSPNNAGVQIVAGVSGQKVKVYDAGFHGAVDGTHYFYFGTTTTATTKRFCTCNKLGLVHKTFVQPRIGDSADGLYLFSSVAETNMPYDIGYVQE